MRSRSLFQCHFPCDLFSSPFQFALRFQVFDDFLSSAPLQFLLPTTFIATNVQCASVRFNPLQFAAKSKLSDRNIS